MGQETFDLMVVGGGPGGYVAAIRAAQLGLKTALVEREHLGGICLNWGCIPTKALLRSAEILDHIKHAADFGLVAAEPSFDLGKIVARSRGVASQLNSGVKHLLKKNKVHIFEGHARLAGKGKVEVELKTGKQTFTAKDIILATGARARALPPVEPDGKLVWSYKEAMTPEILPKSLLIVGSGAIGIEFATFYKTLGVNVTVVEVQDRILPVEDNEISEFARKSFEKQGIKIVTSAKVTAIKKLDNSVNTTIEVDGKNVEMTVDRVIAAVGIVGNIENIGLENTAIRVEGTHIVTDQWCQTAEAGVYAIGDVAGAPWLAHKASHEGILCVEKIAGNSDVHPLNKNNIPGCTYSRPQVASIGLTEVAAKELGYQTKIGRFPFIGNGKAIALGEPDGFIKTIFDENTGELLGAHMVGAEVTELIHGYSIGKTLETTETELIHTIFPHPTLSEMLHEATLAAYGRAIHS